MNTLLTTVAVTMICIFTAVGCRNGDSTDKVININPRPPIVRVGMNLEAARTMLEELGAEDVTSLVNLPREILGPSDRLFCYRLRSGIVVQLYSEPAEKGPRIYRIAVSTDKMGPRDRNRVLDNAETQLDLHLFGVKEVNLADDKRGDP